MSNFRRTEINLRQGQALPTRVRCGTHIVVTQGCVHVDGPCVWMSETLVSAGVRLQEGQVHVVEQPGWIEISATSQASLLHYAPRSAVASVLHALWEQSGRWLGRTDISPNSAH
jgi:hypothetical protein